MKMSLIPSAFAVLKAAKAEELETLTTLTTAGWVLVDVHFSDEVRQYTEGRAVAVPHTPPSPANSYGRKSAASPKTAKRS